MCYVRYLIFFTFVMLLEETNGDLDVIRERKRLIRYIVRCRCREEDVVRYYVAIDHHTVNLFRPR